MQLFYILLSFIVSGLIFAAELENEGNMSKKLLYEEKFRKEWAQDWVLDGQPDLTVLTVEKDGFLKIKVVAKNVFGSVLWYKQPFKGDIELDFDAYVKDRKGKPILFFMAYPINGKPFFSGARTSFYGEYAWDRIMGLYSIGFLRDLCKDGGKSNFRYLGGNIKDDWRNLSFNSRTPDFKKYWKDADEYQKLWNEYESDSKPSDVADGCTAPGKIYRFTARKIGDRIQFMVDGKMIHDVKHDDKATKEFFAPPDEGYIGFRNFVSDSEVWIGNIKFYSLERKK